MLTLNTGEEEKSHPKVLGFKAWQDFRSHPYFIDADTETQGDDVICSRSQSYLLAGLEPKLVYLFSYQYLEKSLDELFYSMMPLNWWGTNGGKNNVSSWPRYTKIFSLVTNDKHWKKISLCMETGVKGRMKQELAFLSLWRTWCE